MSNHATTEEIDTAYRNLTDEEHQALFYYALSMIRGTRFSEPLDLVHEAVYRSLDGRRNWPLHVDFALYLRNTMHSIVSTERKLGKKMVDFEHSVDEVLERGAAFMPHTMSTEDVVLQREQFRLAEAAVAKARDLLSNDFEATSLMDMYLAHTAPSDIREELGMTQKQFNTVYKRVKRCIDSCAPKH